jgi:plasmid maintenance system antidote protein VapI
MALRFCRLVGGESQLFLNMQAGYDLWHAQRRPTPFSKLQGGQA